MTIGFANTAIGIALDRLLFRKRDIKNLDVIFAVELLHYRYLLPGFI